MARSRRPIAVVFFLSVTVILLTHLVTDVYHDPFPVPPFSYALVNFTGPEGINVISGALTWEELNKTFYAQLAERTNNYDYGYDYVPPPPPPPQYIRPGGKGRVFPHPPLFDSPDRKWRDLEVEQEQEQDVQEEFTEDVDDQEALADDQKFMTYLPHGGFHHQRKALENAFMVAHYLNRILILPPLLLGHPIPWSPFEELHSNVKARGKEGFKKCRPYFEGTDPRDPPPGCAAYANEMLAEWEDYFDFEPLWEKTGLDFVQRTDPRWRTGLLPLLGIPPDKASELTIHFVGMDDESQKTWRIYDNPNSTTPLAPYTYRIDLAELAANDARLIHFSSMFGRSRVLAELPENKKFKDFLERRFIFDHPVLNEVAANVIDKLGGQGSFESVIIHAGEPPAEVNLALVEEIYDKLVARYGQKSVLNFRSHNRMKLLSTCLQHRETQEEFPIIYLATSVPNWHQNKHFRKFRTSFPCTFSLADFTRANSLFNIHGNLPDKRLKKFLFPMVDAMVASRGTEVFGSRDSTFTAYVKRVKRFYRGKVLESKSGALNSVMK